MINGGLGVTVFFVVSGFVITRLIASQPDGLFNPDLREFYTRRIARIFPLLILVCFLGIIILTLFPEQSQAFKYIINDPTAPMTSASWISIATFSFNWYLILSMPLREKLHIGMLWSVLWSLSIEEQFYLFYPLALKFLRNKRNLILFLSALIIGGVFSTEALSYFFPNQAHLTENSFRNFSFIAIGCLLYLVSAQLEEVLSKSKKKCVLFCLFGFFLFGIFYWHNYVSVNYWWFFWGTPFFERWIPTFLAFGVFFFLLGGLRLDFFNSKYWFVFSRIGKLSYGGYLYHAFILYLLWPFFAGKNEWLDFFILVAVTFALAELSYRYFEVPANLWIRKTLGRNQ
jgi:peptidoglycan/LPS O-acetylase OafA/YrhL